MGVPFEIPPMAGITVNGGESRTFAVSVPNRGVIDKIIVRQTDGGAESITVAIFAHRMAMDGDAVSDSEGSETGKIHEDAYRVTPDLSTSSYGGNGAFIFFSQMAPGGRGFSYINMEGIAADPERPGRLPRRLYVRITAGGTGANEYCLAIGGEANQ